MSLINTVLQASSVLMNSQNSQWQREREYERGLTALEIEKIRQEHQLKMAYLQQELQQNAREQDRIRQAELRGGELINQADLDKAKLRDSERYLRGTWKEAHFGREQPPYIIFCINPLQDLNQFKDELARIAPFQRTYDNFKTRNAAYVGRLFSTITISETFKSEAEARSFFYRELNCPCIIVYGIFTGTGFGIYALSAGMSPEQLQIDGQKVADWGLRIEKLWDISYNTIHAIKQRAFDDAIKQLKKKAAETGSTLPTDPELLRQKAVELRGRFDVLEGLELYTDTHVGLCVQVMLDNYFSYYPRQVYEVKTPVFLEAKQKELTRLGIWEALKTSLLERYEVLKGRQSKQFLTPTNPEPEFEVDTENDSLQINDKEFCEVDYTTLRESMYGFEWEIKDKEGNWRKIFTFSPQQIHFKLLPYTNPDYYWPTSNLHQCVDGEYRKSDAPYIYEWPSFEKGLCCIRTGGSKYGFIDPNGEEIIPAIWPLCEGINDGFVVVGDYNEEEYYKNSTEPIPQSFRRRYFLFDSNNVQVLEQDYKNLSVPDNGLLACSTEEWDEKRKIMLKKIIDLRGNTIFEGGYHVEYATENLYVVYETTNRNGDEKAHIIDRKGKILKSGSEIKYLGNVPEPFFLIRDKNVVFIYNPKRDTIIKYNSNFFNDSFTEIAEKQNRKLIKVHNVLFHFDECKNLGEGFFSLCMTFKGNLKNKETSNIEKAIKLFNTQKPQPDEIIEWSQLQIQSFADEKCLIIFDISEAYFRRNLYMYFSEGKIVFETKDKSNKWYFVGKSAIEEDFDPKKNKTYDSATPYSEGLAAVKEGNFWGFIDHDERTQIPFIYEDARPFSEGYAAVKKNGKYGVINKNCRTVIPFVFKNISFFKNGYNCVCLKEGNITQRRGESIIEHPKWAIINKEGKILVM